MQLNDLNFSQYKEKIFKGEQGAEMQEEVNQKHSAPYN